jgi:hypothetical protein
MRTTLSLILGAALALPAVAAEAPAVVAPGENLVAEHVPPIPQTLVDSVGRYSEFRSASFGGWHPTRRELLITTRFGDTNQCTTSSSRAATASSSRSRGERRAAGLPARRERSHSVPQGPRRRRILPVLPLRPRQRRHHAADRRQVAQHLADLGQSRHALRLRSTRRNGKDTDLWVGDSSDPKADRMVAELSGGGWNPADWSPDDARVLVAEYISANDSNLYLFDARSGAKTLLTPKPEGAQVAYGGAQFARDGKGVYITTDKDYEFHRLAYIDLATRATATSPPASSTTSTSSR